ncbi:MAG: FAD-binding domain-containing protein [Woeseiaceae bacterium]|nr:FAD-binding domain-containing protein [Woeseiaceae bacterium]
MSDHTLYPDASRAAGLERLTEFLPRAGRDYARTRNFDYGPDNRGNVSVLSPYVRHRLVLESEVLEQTLERHSSTAAEKFVQEVFWRAYFKGWLEQHPDVWRRYRRDLVAAISTLEVDADLCAAYDRAVTGQTGIDCFDAWVDELTRTGYLHNHARMWFASIWIFTLRLPWQLGADFFLRHLLDGDPASNTLSWRWVGGLHTRGKTYLARVSNITSYTDDRFNPVGQLAAAAPPLAEDEPPTRVALPEVPLPELKGRVGLLITEEDCHGLPLELDTQPTAVLGLTATALRSPLTVGQPAAAFAAAAVADGTARTAAAFEVPSRTQNSVRWDDALTEFAAEHALDTIVTAYAPVGPVAELLRSTEKTLDERDISLVRVRRHYDEATWPYAGKGYFKLKSRIPEILDTLSGDIMRETA